MNFSQLLDSPLDRQIIPWDCELMSSWQVAFLVDPPSLVPVFKSVIKNFSQLPDSPLDIHARDVLFLWGPLSLS